MPPKKAVKEEKILLGRPGNNLKSGIVGLANVGKSTLFNAISKVSPNIQFNNNTLLTH
jgi:obg-like ATPase 1